jgi:hypothetical protein
MNEHAMLEYLIAGLDVHPVHWLDIEITGEL